jgi:hypothetical protein
MTDVTAKLAKKTGPKKGNDRKVPSEITALDRCYGQIGISAVAAAARYQGNAKNAADQPASSKWRDLFAEAAT